MKILAKNAPRNTFWDILDDFGKIDIFAPQNRPKWAITAKMANMSKKRKIDLKFVFFDSGGSNWAQTMPNGFLFQIQLTKN